MKIGLFSLIFVFANFCFQFSLLSFPEEVYQKMIAQDYEGMRAAVEKVWASSADDREIIKLMPQGHSFYKEDFLERSGIDSMYIGRLSIFHIAALLRDLRALEILLEFFPRSIDVVDNFLSTPLNLVCCSPSKEILPVVNLLINLGADVNMGAEKKDSRDVQVVNPLSHACEVRNYPVIEYLLFRGAKIKYLLEDSVTDMFRHKLSEKTIVNGVETTIFHTFCDIEETLLIVDMLFLCTENEHEVKKLRAIIQNALMGYVRAGNIDRNRENYMQKVEEFWASLSPKEHLLYPAMPVIDRLERNGYSKSIAAWGKDKNGKKVATFQLCHKEQNTKEIIYVDMVKPFMAIMMNRMNKRYSSFEAVHLNKYPTPRKNKGTVFAQVKFKKNKSLKFSGGNIMDTIRSREMGGGSMVYDIVCTKPGE